MLYPTLDEIRQLRDAEMTVRADTRKPLLPICCDILADMETPVSAYCKIASGPYSFLLESVVGGEHIARYSFIGIDPYLVMILDGNTATLNRAKSERDACIEEVSCSDPLQRNRA
jgi:anthranilate synthase component I